MLLCHCDLLHSLKGHASPLTCVYVSEQKHRPCLACVSHLRSGMSHPGIQMAKCMKDGDRRNRLERLSIMK